MNAALNEAVVPDMDEILADPASSKWLKAALESTARRDPVDALNDTLLLAAVLEQRLRTTLDL